MRDKNLSLVIVKDRKTLFQSNSSGIAGLIQVIDLLGQDLQGASAADKVVGRAAALLLAQFGASKVYAHTLSKEGLKVLRENDIFIEYDGLVPKILDRTGKDICPFESFSLTIRSRDEAYEKLKSCLESFRVNG